MLTPGDGEETRSPPGRMEGRHTHPRDGEDGGETCSPPGRMEGDTLSPGARLTHQVTGR